MKPAEIARLPTPETDAISARLTRGGYVVDMTERIADFTLLSRSLERRLAAATMALEAVKVGDQTAEWNAATRHGANWRNELIDKTLAAIKEAGRG